MSIAVEVCVQDCLAEATATAADASAAQPIAVPIPSEQWEPWMQAWLDHLQPHLSPIDTYELSLRLTDDPEIQALNAQYRQQDKPTDVLAFAALEADVPAIAALESEHPLYLGDIVISVQTAQRQALAQNHSLTTELAWLAAHGLLHLLGWDHPDEESLQRMLSEQQALLTVIGLWNDAR